MKVKDLKPADYNPRKITDKKLDMLGKSMKEFGDLSGIIYNRKTGKLIGGHNRIKHLQPEWEIVKDADGNGYIDTPEGKWTYREVDWDEKKEIAANIAANKHGGEFDIIKLKDLLVEIDDGSIDMELTGFELQEIDDLFSYEKERLPERCINLKGFEKTHILISFAPDKIGEVDQVLKGIENINGLEIEIGSNG